MAALSNLKKPIAMLAPALTAGVLFSGWVLAQETAYRAPRTSDGAPDLQGTWTNNTITPLTRPDEFSELVLTRDQAIALERQVAEYTEQQDQPSDPDRTAPQKDQIELADSSCPCCASCPA